MPKTTLNLPRIVIVDDYHDFNVLQDALRWVIPGVKVREVGFVDGKHKGVIYLGAMNAAVNNLIQQIKQEEKEGD